jgi:hypothetical protein
MRPLEGWSAEESNVLRSPHASMGRFEHRLRLPVLLGMGGDGSDEEVCVAVRPRRSPSSAELKAHVSQLSEHAICVCGRTDHWWNRCVRSWMSDKATEFRDAYAAALLAFNAASAILILALAADARPTDEQIAAEMEARANVESARERLWAEYAKKSSANVPNAV